jgi:dATP pyrophosphohydrolase
MIPIRCAMVSVLAMQGSGETARLLLLQRAGEYLHGVWSYVAGHVEEGEAGWQAAERELAEETGLAPVALYVTSFCEQIYDPRADCIQIIPAFVAMIGEDTSVRLNEEHAAFRWATFAEAAEALPFGSQRDLLAHVRREFVGRRPAQFLKVPPE